MKPILHILNRLFVIPATTSILILSGCSAPPEVSMPPAQISRFVLDLSGSNDALDQYERLKPSIYRELKLDSVGNPFAAKPTGPVNLSITFIVGSASQARVESIISSDFGFKLFSDLVNVYGRSTDQIASDWPLVIAADRKALDLGLTSDLRDCVSKISKTMEVNLGSEISIDIANKICSRALDTIDIIESKVPKSISLSNGSDVFGAFREIDTWVEKERVSNPGSTIKVTFASDMVHWTNGQRDLFGAKGLLTNKIAKNDICAIAEEQSRISALNLTDVKVEIIGRGNSSSVSADQGEALAIFWKCFADASHFELNTVSDGRA
jgi:hypothetical protein